MATTTTTGRALAPEHGERAVALLREFLAKWDAWAAEVSQLVEACDPDDPEPHFPGVGEYLEGDFVRRCRFAVAAIDGAEWAV